MEHAATKKTSSAIIFDFLNFTFELNHLRICGKLSRLLHFELSILLFFS